MRLGSDKTPLDKQNKRFGASVAAVILLLAMVFTVFAPVVAIAEGEEATVQGLIQEPASAPVVEMVPPTAVPTAVPVPPTAVPVPPTAVPVVPTSVPTQIPVPPTTVPPTAVPTSVPTLEPTQAPTTVPTAVPTAVPTEQVWINTDSLRVTDSVTAHTVNQGGQATVSITYNVTTPRTGTTVHARLVGAGEGWTIFSPILADADASATSAAWTQTSTLQPGTSFTLPIVITAPATVAQVHSVSLHLWSTAAGEKGQETGVPKTDRRMATIAVLAPPPTPVPTEIPTQEPTAVPTMGSISTPTIEPTSELTSEPEIVIAATPESSHVNAPEARASTQTRAQSQIAATPVVEFAGRFEGDPSCVRQSGGSDIYICAISWGTEKIQSVDIENMDLRGASGCSMWADDESKKKTCANESGMGNAGNDKWDGKLRIQLIGSGAYLKFDVVTKKSGTHTMVIGTPPEESAQVGDLLLACTPLSGDLSLNPNPEINCEISADKTQFPKSGEVLISNVAVTAPAGLAVKWSRPEEPASLSGTVRYGTPFTFGFSLERTACVDETYTVTVQAEAGIIGLDPKPILKQDIVITNAIVVLPPTVSLNADPVSFGTMTWNGEEDGYGFRSQTTTLIVKREPGCGSSNPEVIQIATTGSTKQPTLKPEYSGSEIESGSEITSREGSNGLQVSPEFSGEEEVHLNFTLTPPDNIPPGEYDDMKIIVTVVDGQ